MNKLRVLIVDDSARTISLIKDSLSEDTEVEIVGQAENGVEAIEMIRETKPDVVFLDLIMPKMDGLLVLEKVCQGLPGIEKRPKFIVVTAVTQENVMQTAFQYGAAYYVLKPFEKETIQAKIQQLKPGGIADCHELSITRIRQKGLQSGNGCNTDHSRDWCACAHKGLSVLKRCDHDVCR